MDDQEKARKRALDEYDPKNTVNSIVDFMGKMVMTPARFVRENLVEPFRPTESYPWYHRRFQRVPTIDECYMDDAVCKREANLQYFRDRGVEQAIVKLLYQRFNDCVIYEYPDVNDEGGVCNQIREQYDLAAKNWYIKYGDMGVHHKAEDALMKQKHRMIWERRHGTVGAGMKQKGEEGWGEVPKKDFVGLLGEEIQKREGNNRDKKWSMGF